MWNLFSCFFFMWISRGANNYGSASSSAVDCRNDEYAVFDLGMLEQQKWLKKKNTTKYKKDEFN